MAGPESESSSLPLSEVGLRDFIDYQHCPYKIHLSCKGQQDTTEGRSDSLQLKREQSRTSRAVVEALVTSFDAPESPIDDIIRVVLTADIGSPLGRHYSNFSKDFRSSLLSTQEALKNHGYSMGDLVRAPGGAAPLEDGVSACSPDPLWFSDNGSMPFSLIQIAPVGGTGPNDVLHQGQWASFCHNKRGKGEDVPSAVLVPKTRSYSKTYSFLSFSPSLTPRDIHAISNACSEISKIKRSTKKAAPRPSIGECGRCRVAGICEHRKKNHAASNRNKKALKAFEEYKDWLK